MTNKASLQLFSPAKTNLFFKLLGKRKDSLHEVCTLIQACSFGDMLFFSFSGFDSFSVNSDFSDVPRDSSNLVIKARDLFRQVSDIDFSISIHLDKQIPTQSGLGGGSSNAATTLWALNKLCKYPFTIQELQALASQLGSDVAFFLSSGTALCKGKGDQIISLEQNDSLQDCYFYFPEMKCSTAEIYRHTNCSYLKGNEDLEELIDESEMSNYLRSYSNDLEQVAFKKYPELYKIKQELLKQFNVVFLSGSGSAFVCADPLEFVSEDFIPFYFINRTNKDSWYAE